MASGPRQPGRIYTFYSYKGGTGRTMLLANTGWLLASAGYHVLLVDWDLEAPGLHRYMAPFLTDPQMTDSNGLIDMIVTYAAEAVEPAAGRGHPGEWLREKADVLDYSVSINWKYPNGGTLTLLPSGRQGSAYGAKVNTFSWQNFYDRLGGHAFFEALKESMRQNFDFVLIDSRTGVSDTAGICTVQFPDSLVICFTLNNQSIEGAAAVAASVRAQKGDRFGVFPVPTRLDNSESDKLLERWKLAKDRFDTFLPSDHRSYWDDVYVPYVPKFAYEEVLAVFGNRADDPSNLNLLSQARRLTKIVFNVSPANEQIPDVVRANVQSHFAGRNVQVSPAEAQRLADAERQASETRLAEQIAQAQSEVKEELEAKERKKRVRWTVNAAVASMALVLLIVFMVNFSRQSEAAEQAITAGNQAMEARNWEEARLQYGKAIDAGKGDADLHAKRAKALLQLGDSAAALNDIDVALAFRPNDPKFMEIRASALRGKGDLPGAVAQLAALIPLQPENLGVYESLASAQQAMGALDDARKTYSQLIVKAPDRLDLVLQRGILSTQLNDSKAAVSDFEKVAKDDPDPAKRTYAVAQLKGLGVTFYTNTKPPAPVEAVVHVHYAADADAEIALRLTKALQAQGVKTASPKRAAGPRGGEIRYYRPEDLESAARAKRLVEVELANQRQLVTLAMKAFPSVGGGKAPPTIEVWLPGFSYGKGDMIQTIQAPPSKEIGTERK